MKRVAPASRLTLFDAIKDACFGIADAAALPIGALAGCDMTTCVIAAVSAGRQRIRNE
jgi:queuine/archaeosine tRNA-ribosyltransferase